MKTVQMQVGSRFGYLEVIGRADPPLNKIGKAMWMVRCVCGTEKAVGGWLLRMGNTRSCGCKRLEMSRYSRVTHGESKSRCNGTRPTPEFSVWNGMRQRCLNPNNDSYANYGGRGITICSRWDVYQNFLEDMGRRPSLRHTLDRKDNDGPYSPENCRWALQREQCRNKRNNHLISFMGQTHTLKEWSEITGIHEDNITRRIELGWSLEHVLTKPVGGMRLKTWLRNSEGRTKSS